MPSPVYLLDTNVVLHLVRGNAVGKELAAAFGLLNNVNRLLISIVSHGELLLLAARNKWGAEKRAALENALDNLVAVDLNDKAVLSAYVEVQQYSRQAPGGSRELNANDAWIVACAKAADATLLTTDRDFSHLKAPDWPVQFFDMASFSGSPEQP
jgi:tRNA(fMet)-specific endonuclease VapC